MIKSVSKPVDPELIKGSRDSGEWEIVTYLRSAKENLAEGRLELLARNIKSGATGALALGMLIARIDRDFQAAAATFGRGINYLPYFEEGLAAVRRSPQAAPRKIYHLWDFPLPLMLSVLADKWDWTSKLLQILREPEVDVPPAKSYNYGDLQAWMLVACLEGDLPAFSEYKARFDQLKRDKAQLTFDVYASQYEAILQRDGGRLQQLVKEAEGAFLKRSGMQVGANIIEGGKQFNPLCLDFRSLAACRIAKKMGMDIVYDSEYVPQELIMS